MVPMVAQVGFPGLEVRDGSYGGPYGSYGCPGRVFLASRLRMVPLVVPMVPMAARVGFPGLDVTDGSCGGSYGSSGCPGRLSRPQSYGRFLWMVLMVPLVVGLRMAAR